MVFNSVSETETPPLTPPMASSTFSAKSQPLHNFPLSNLKWSMNQPNSQRMRRISDANHHSPTRGFENRPVSPLSNDDGVDHHHHRNPRKDGDSDQNPELPRPGSVSPVKSENSSGPEDSEPVSDGEIGKSGFTLSAAENLREKEEKSVAMGSIESSEKKVAGTARGVEKMKGSEGKSKVFVRFPGRNKGSVHATDADEEAQFAYEDEEPMVKTWNLRPRKAVTKKPPNANGGAHRNEGPQKPGGPQKNGGAQKNGRAPVQENKPLAKNQPEMAVVRAVTEEKAGQKRLRFSLSLTKEEIEKDFLIMTGSKPPKKLKKRARNVQKQLDVGFPGLWLASVTADMYRVPDPPLKA